MYVYFVRWSVLADNGATLFAGQGEFKLHEMISTMENILRIQSIIRNDIHILRGIELTKEDVILIDFYSLLRKEK